MAKVQANVALNKKAKLIKSDNINFEARKNFVKSCVRCTAVYSSET